MEDPSSRLAKLYRRFSQPLIHALQGKEGGRAKAEDAVQNVFMRMIASGSLPQTGKEYAYLMRAASNQRIDRFRQEARESESVPLSVDALAEEDRAGMAQLRADEVLEGLQRQQQLARLREALLELPARQREAFALHMIEGHSQPEVAARMGITLRMVSRHVGSALAYCELRLQYGSLEQMQRLRQEVREQPVPNAGASAAPCGTSDENMRGTHAR
ncbi:RNA polymerase sigma factor [Corticibacter populi]|uniref:RNA polymerase sigma factor n=1 Tax=Corticibacter populi TaxID=1550736 RepID=UPI0013C320DA|nr:sigma-70 family RNA polymerase sigma factor [Corticibacter populi]